MTAPDDPRTGEELAADVLAAPGPPDQALHRDRREHGGAADRLDDDYLAARTEQERVDAGLVDYTPGGVPPATDDLTPIDVAGDEAYQQGVEEVDREVADGRLASGERPDFPPSSYPE